MAGLATTANRQRHRKRSPDPPAHSVALIEHICALASSPDFFKAARLEARRAGLTEAVRQRNTPALFNWFAAAASYQGISDSVAEGFIEKNGRANWAEMERELEARAICPKLHSYWQFHGCKYRKGANCCSEPDHMERCPLPQLPLRNGNLKQLACSLFLFMRDVAECDFVGWIDSRLAEVDPSPEQRPERLGIALIQPLKKIHGLSDKVLSMALSDLLLGASVGRPMWVEAGGGLIAIDTLVHNFLHRTGILRQNRAQHPYGPACYQIGGCADVLRTISSHIDARQFNASFPANFPRFVQKAIWTYCAGNEMNICNGNKIDDLARCGQVECRLYGACGRIKLTS